MQVALATNPMHVQSKWLSARKLSAVATTTFLLTGIQVVSPPSSHAAASTISSHAVASVSKPTSRLLVVNKEDVTASEQELVAQSNPRAKQERASMRVFLDMR